MAIRRIYARENICVPSGMMVNVPVDLAYANLYAPYTDWITEAKRIKKWPFSGKNCVIARR
jgi:hypothetical protein